MPSYLEAYRLARAQARGPSSYPETDDPEQEPLDTPPPPPPPPAVPEIPATGKSSNPKAFQKAKLGLDNAQGVNESKFSKAKVLSWQKSANESASPDEAGPKPTCKQTPIVPRARAKTFASPGVQQDKSNDENAESSQEPRPAVKIDGVVVEVRASTAPKKRVVSDEHWLKDRPALQAAQSAPPQLRNAQVLGDSNVYARTGNKKPDAWVRRKSTPKKVKPELLKNSEQPEISPAEALSPSPQEQNTKIAWNKRKGVSAPATPAAEEKAEAPNAGKDAKDEVKATPKGAEDKFPTPQKETPKKYMQVRRRSTPWAPRNHASSSDEEIEPREVKPPIKTFTGRMQAWLSQTPDPFTDKLEDPTPGNNQVRQAENRKGDGRKSGKQHPISPLQSDSEDQLSQSSSNLRRNGARHGARSPNKGRSFSQGVNAASAARRENPTETMPKHERQNLRDIDGNATGGNPRQNRQSFKKSLSRTLTSHADLISVLSQPQGVKGLVSARTIRTTRRKVEETTLTDIADELRSDESKYLRELRTLVDGVIPVLLNSALNRPKSRAANDVVDGLNEASISKDTIVDLGIALERLLNMHKRIPIYDLDGFISWAERAFSVYQNYIDAWRLGFQDLVVNLAPGELEDNKATWNGESGKDEFNLSGDGERVDVAFLLKRPLVRIKYLTKSLRALDHVRPSKYAANWSSKFQELMDQARWKQDKERARLEDEAASNVDLTRTRDPETLAALPGVRIRRDRCVRARDLFDLKLYHTSGQRLDCHVMLIFRDDISGAPNAGDVLICEVDSSSRWLLLPPFELQHISARHGNQKHEIVVMIRGYSSSGQEWRELISLAASNQDAAADWVDMLGSNPLPPSISSPYSFKHSYNDRFDIKNGTTLWAPNQGRDPSPSDLDVPLGEQSVLSSRMGESDLRSPADRGNLLSAQTQSPQRDSRIRNNNYAPVARDFGRHEEPNKLEMSNSKVSQWLSIGAGAGASQSSPRANPNVDEHINQDDYSRMDDFRKGPNRFSLPRRLSTVPSEGLLSFTKPREAQETTHRSMPSTPNRDNNHVRALTNPVSLPPAQLRGSSTPHLSPTAGKSYGPRRSSSPLKYEYDPSSASDRSSIRGRLQSDDDCSVSSESSIEDMVADPKLPRSAVAQTVRLHPQADKYLPKGRDSASRQPTIPNGLHQSLPNTEQQELAEPRKVIASMFSWADKGCWELLHPDECSIVVSPGLIEAFEMSAAHSAEQNLKNQAPDYRNKKKAKPLIALELTPLVPLRQGTAIDISIRSPPTPNSQIRTGSNIMFRSRTGPECEFLYSLINQARINNPTYIALQNARGPVGGSNWASFMDRQASTRGGRSWWRLGSRKSSYRASNTKRSASLAETISSVPTKSSAMSALRRFTGGSKMFNVEKSTISSRGARSDHRSSSSHGPDSRPGTPGAPEADPSKDSPAGITDMSVRLYERETASKWRDMGSGRLTIMHPPGPSEGVILPTGHLLREKRVVVAGKTRGETLLDVTLGETSFERVARTGIAVKVWEQFDQTAKTGGVIASRVRVYMIQMKSEAEAAYTFSLVGRLRY